MGGGGGAAAVRAEQLLRGLGLVPSEWSKAMWNSLVMQDRRALPDLMSPRSAIQEPHKNLDLDAMKAEKMYLDMTERFLLFRMIQNF